mgnify:CR=1 FL=1
MKRMIVYQKANEFVLTREIEKEIFDAEEFLRVLNNSRERLKWLERDIKEMEKLEPVARRIRDKEIMEGRESRNAIRNTK